MPQAPHTLSLQGDLTIYQAAELKVTLHDALRDRVELEIDLSRVSELDSAGVQLLLQVRRAAADAGHGCRLRNPSSAVCEVLGLLGLQALVDAPSAALA